MESIWSRTAKIPERQPLDGDKKAEAAVIGGGMAGILTAYFLQESGLDTVVLEADRIGSGQTCNTTAKITSQHGMIYTKLIEKYGMEDARLYGEIHEAAIEEYERLVTDLGISCGFRRLPAYLYSRTEKETLIEEAESASDLGLPAHFTEQTELPFPIAGAVRFDNQAQFHPLEFLRGISRSLTIYENTRVRSVRGHHIYTDRGTVTANHIVFAAHYPFVNAPGFYFARQHQERSYVVAYKNVKPLNGMYYCVDREAFSLRSHGEILLAGGGGHRTGENICGNSYNTVRRQAEEAFPQGQETACWSAQDCMTHDELPFIGQYSLFKPYWHVATGFRKWGMTSSMAAAKLIRDEIWNLENPYAPLFLPQRFHLKAGCKNRREDYGKSIQGLCAGLCLLFRKDRSHRRCTHLGCALNRNQEEGTWECPCHGSQFSQNGHVLSNPAQKPLKPSDNS